MFAYQIIGVFTAKAEPYDILHTKILLTFTKRTYGHQSHEIFGLASLFLFVLDIDKSLVIPKNI